MGKKWAKRWTGPRAAPLALALFFLLLAPSASSLVAGIPMTTDSAFETPSAFAIEGGIAAISVAQFRLAPIAKCCTQTDSWPRHY
jgi:hypothetical protein